MSNPRPVSNIICWSDDEYRVDTSAVRLSRLAAVKSMLCINICPRSLW